MQSSDTQKGERKEVLCERDGRLGNAGALGELRGITVLSTKGRNNRGQKETGLFIFPGMAEKGGLANRVGREAGRSGH